MNQDRAASGDYRGNGTQNDTQQDTRGLRREGRSTPGCDGEASGAASERESDSSGSVFAGDRSAFAGE